VGEGWVRNQSRPAPLNTSRLPGVEGFWPIFFLGVVLKIPIAAALFLVWYAVRAEPETEELPDDGEHGFRRWRRAPRLGGARAAVAPAPLYGLGLAAHRLLEVRDQVLRGLDPAREPDQVGRDGGLRALHRLMGHRLRELDQ
jgi:hypothetical protein